MINFVKQNFQGLFQIFRLRIELTIRLRFLLRIPGCMITHFIERGFGGGTGEIAALALDILSLKFQQLELTKNIDLKFRKKTTRGHVSSL